jgi:hypothetical protein
MTKNHRNRPGTTVASNDPSVTVYYLSELKLAVAPVKGHAVNILKATPQVMNAIQTYDPTAVFTDTNNKQIQLTKFPDSKKTHKKSGRPPPGHDRMFPQFRQTALRYQKASSNAFKHSMRFSVRTYITLGPKWIQYP